MSDFLNELRTTLEEFMNPPTNTPRIPCAVAMVDSGDYFVIKVHLGSTTTEIRQKDIPPNIRELVIWRFKDNTAYIKLAKPLDFERFTAELMAGELFGQGLSREWGGENDD